MGPTGGVRVVLELLLRSGIRIGIGEPNQAPDSSIETIDATSRYLTPSPPSVKTPSRRPLGDRKAKSGAGTESGGPSVDRTRNARNGLVASAAAMAFLVISMELVMVRFWASLNLMGGVSRSSSSQPRSTTLKHILGAVQRSEEGIWGRGLGTKHPRPKLSRAHAEEEVVAKRGIVWRCGRCETCDN